MTCSSVVVDHVNGSTRLCIFFNHSAKGDSWSKSLNQKWEPDLRKCVIQVIYFEPMTIHRGIDVFISYLSLFYLFVCCCFAWHEPWVIALDIATCGARNFRYQYFFRVDHMASLFIHNEWKLRNVFNEDSFRYI